MTRVAKYLEVLREIVSSISVSMMDQESSFRIASVARFKLDQFPIIVAEPSRFIFPVSISVLRNLLSLKYVTAFFRTSNRRLGEQFEADHARAKSASSFPIWIIFASVVSFGKTIPFSAAIDNSHAMTRAEVPPSLFDSRGELVKTLAAFSARAFNFRHECILSCIGH